MIKLKAVISGLLLIVFLILTLSGALLHIGKTGMIWGIARHALRDAHALAAVLMLLLLVAHLFLNRRVFLKEWKALLKCGTKNEKHEKRE